MMAAENKAGRPVVTVIDLNGLDAECYVCDQDTSHEQGIAIYEDLIVPNDYTGEWGGVPACRRCYVLALGLQAENPGQAIPIAWVRHLAAA
jgi:hypothetical protein